MNPVQSWRWFWRTLSRSRQGVKDVVFSAIPQLVGVFTGFLSSIFIARGLGPIGMGQFALVMSLAGVATTLSDLGLGQTAIRYASRAAANNDEPGQMSVLRWALRWRLSLVFLVTTAFFIVAPYITELWRSETLTPYLRLGLLGGVFAALASVPTVYFQSVKRFATNASVISGQKIISLVCVFALTVFNLWSLLSVLLVTLAASAVGAIAFLIMVPRAAIWPEDAMCELRMLSLRRLAAKPNIQSAANGELDSSSPTGFLRFHMLSTIIVMATLQADVWMMGYFLDKGEIGVYSVATRFTLPLTIALGALNTALWPRASGITAPHHLLRLVKTTFALTALVACLALIYSASAPLLAPFLFGTAYGNSAMLGQLLSLRYCLSLLICPLGIIGYSFGLVRFVWLINLAQLMVVIYVNIHFLPQIGANASAIALLASEVAGGMLFGLFFARKYWQLKRSIEITGSYTCEDSHSQMP